MSFEAQLEDDACGLAVDARPGSPLLIAFSGLALQLGMPVFEFREITRRIAGPSFVFARDHKRSWYHRGIAGVSEDVDGTVAALRATVDALAPSRVVTVGTSAGGYAALLFGELLGAHATHAFGPQVFLDRPTREQYGEDRWAKLDRLWDRGLLEERYCDLAAVISPQTAVRHHIWWGEERDGTAVQRLADRATVTRFGTQHNTARAMRDTGQLQRLLDDALLG
jgi:hypothetical protein